MRGMSEERRQDVLQEPMKEPGKSRPSIAPARIWRAFGYSLQGLAGAWRTEGAIKQEALAAVVLVPTALFVNGLVAVERVLLVASVLLVIVVELLNSALEAVVDRIGPERHPLSRKAKDTGSAAVLVAIVIALVAWGAILGPRAWSSL